LDSVSMKPDTFFHDLVLPINAAKPIPERNRKAIKENLEILLHTFEHARELGMMDILLHINVLKLMYEKWSAGEQAK
jgi:hypothetical protein